MNKGLSLVELLVSMTIASVLILMLFSMNLLCAGTYTDVRDNWYCMQSLRNALVLLERDLAQCACLMPQDLKIALAENQLFIAGIPVTSKHSGLSLPQKYAPPLFSVVRSTNDRSIVLDTIDIDADTVADYWADLGIITDSGPYVISHSYSRGNNLVEITAEAATSTGDRIVPAIHYALRSDGLYRNAQLIAEAVNGFDMTMEEDILTIRLQAGYNHVQKQISYPFVFK
jgi:prepilin-type N-terminal cleavage/methylation domain-containing protein